MSRYTTEVRYICEAYNGASESGEYDSVEDTIAGARDKIFDFSYPIFDEEYRSVLETKILKHYYTREIGSETVGLWKLRLNTLMNELMPYYNKLYSSELIEFDPMHDFSYQTTRNVNGTQAGADNRTINGSDDSTTNGHSYINNNDTNYNLLSDTPQGSLSGVDSQTYLTQAVKNTDVGQTENTNTTTMNRTNETKDNTTKSYTTTESYIENVVGKRGGESFSKLLQDFRETFLNIDLMVINSLEPLFMQLW